MAKTRPPYPAAFRQQIIELARNGRSIADLAAEFEPSHQTIRNWLLQAGLTPSIEPQHTLSDESEELRRLRKENRRLQQERDILAKAAAWFARETNAIPSKSSSS